MREVEDDAQEPCWAYREEGRGAARVIPTPLRKTTIISCFCLKIQSQESYKYLYLSSKNKNNISNTENIITWAFSLCRIGLAY